MIFGDITMHYIIMDLEWNTALIKETKGYLNEIIEIGAVRLDENLVQTDEFRIFIKPKLSKKIHSRVQSLTHIHNSDLENGVPFIQAMDSFKEWVEALPCAILSWGETDLRVLIENYKYFCGISCIPFMQQYADLQAYVQKYLRRSSAQQLGLSAAAQMLNVNLEGIDLHRALADSILSACCLREIFYKLDFRPFLRTCNNEFYDRLSFKSYFISDINSPLIDKSLLKCVCSSCGAPMEQLTQWDFKSQAFRALFYCKHCDKKFRYSVRYKKSYDHVTAKQKLNELTEEKQDESTQTV